MWYIINMEKMQEKQYKLFILYMLKKAQFCLSNSQIVSFFQDLEILDYFSVQNIVGDMLETGLIEENKGKTKSLYSISNSGQECIKYFESDIGNENLAKINDYLAKNKIQMREESNCLADFCEGKNCNYDAQLEILEGKDSLFSLKITVPDPETARQLCENWKENSQNIYQYIMKKLLG